MSFFRLVRDLLPLLLAVVTHAAERRPNFLFVYTDDQRWDAMGVVQREQGDAARYPWFRTPHMDRLAAEGIRFRNAFVTLALCAPSRAAFLTGRYNHLNGVIDNHTPFPTDSVTHASLMRATGYVTGYVGKWHMGMQRGQRPGFSYSASYVGQGRYVDCPFEINGEPTPTTGWIDDVATDYAIAFLRENRARPFSLIVGFKSCHVPLTPPERAKDRFAGEEWRTVPSMATRAIYRDPPSPSATPAAKRPTNLNYFRCVSAADDNLGRMLATLDELKLAENTVVIFTSDNGYLQGEHGLGDKRCAYEESIRIPLLIRYPGKIPANRTIDQLVLNLDVAPTLLELAGLPVPAEMQGSSWVPLFAGRIAGWRDSFLYEYFLEAAYPQTPTVLAVRTTEAKLVKYPGRDDWTELFDLRSDPYELKNLARDPAHKELLLELQTEFARLRGAIAFRTPENAGLPAPGR